MPRLFHAAWPAAGLLAVTMPAFSQQAQKAPSPTPAAAANPRATVVVTEAGSSLFRTYCSACHGLTGQGDGPLADQLRVRPADLTLLARHDKGTFDKEKARRIVDGRDPVKGHGGPDMPVWGDAFKEADEGYSERKAAQRIQALVEYLEEIQVR
jgi:mono/diheme cytochrome c family protein